MPVKSAVTIQAQWQVTAEADEQQETRIVWATDADLFRTIWHEQGTMSRRH